MTTVSRIILVTGGARSGKSALAERIAGQFDMPRIYIATATAGDDEMKNRIARHREMRGPGWLTVEETLDLAGALARTDGQGVRLVDCLTLWLTNLLMLDDAERLAAEREALLNCLATLPGEIIFVSNETGMGVVPLGELTRRYVDEAGWLHQALAERCQRVVLTVAGLPLTLKGTAL